MLVSEVLVRATIPILTIVSICWASPVDQGKESPEIPILDAILGKSSSEQIETTTLASLSDADSESAFPDAYIIVNDDDAKIITNISSYVPNSSQQQNEFPTPLPFLKEPEEIVKAVKDGPPSRGTLVPPNFDITRIPGISGTTKEGTQYTPVYVGRQACKCGVTGERRFAKFNDTKIVGGEPAPIEEYPWTAALLRRNWLGLVSDRPYCGGTLINNQYILTASHCVDGMSPRSIVAVLHEEDVSSTSETPSGTTRFEIEKIIMHQNYNRRSIDNDIALLKLASPVTLNSVIIPACLPANNDHDFQNFTATAAGWGATKESGPTSNVLRKVEVPVIGNTECNTQTKYKGKITDNMLCAGYVETGQKDSCQGDSGGPLTIVNGERLMLIGIVSWGYGCARPNSPGVYTRVARYPEWIVANSKDAEWCLE